MSLIQYGGSVGLTTDGQRIPNTTILEGIPLIAIGSAQYTSADIKLLITSTSITSGPSTLGYKLKLEYYTGSTITSAKFDMINTGYVDAPVGPIENFFPSPQQVFEIVFKYGTYDTVAHTTAADGEITVYKNNISIFSVTGIALTPRAGAGSSWGFVEFGPAGWANSYYISQSTTRVAGYGTQTFSTPGSIVVTVATSLMTAPFTYPDPENFTFPSDSNILEAGNFSAANPTTFFVSGGGHWQVGHGTAGSNPVLNTTGINVLNGAQTWSIAAQMLNAPTAGYIYNVTASPFTPHTIVPPPTPPSGKGTLIVTKTTIPAEQANENFTFLAGGGLSPSTFTLKSGQSQTFLNLNPGSGYSISENADPNFTTTFTVSGGGGTIDNLIITTNSTTTVTVTNSFVGLLGGIYKIVDNKRNDTLYITGDVKIPDPSFKTGLIGG